MSSELRVWSEAVDPAREPYRVAMTRGKLVDEARGGRIVPLKIYSPLEHGLTQLPVILWSHGLGGSADGAAFLSRFLASHGYVLVHVQHSGTNSSLWEGKPGHPWDVIRATPLSPDAALNRFRDIPFVLDHLPQWTAGNNIAADPTTLGISGHSFGALTTQLMAGQTEGRGGVNVSGLHEPRFRSGILYSPVPSSTGTGYDGIKIPLFHMTGTADESPLEPFGHEKRLDVFHGSGGPTQSALILNGGDHMVFNGSRSQLAENPKRKLHEDIIKVAALAFWDATLGGNENAAQWLTGGGFAGWLNNEGTYHFRPRPE